MHIRLKSLGARLVLFFVALLVIVQGIGATRIGTAASSTEHATSHPACARALSRLTARITAIAGSSGST